MGKMQWGYNDMLADLAGKGRIPDRVRVLYDFTHETRVKNLTTYKNVEYDLGADGFYHPVDKRR